MTDLLSSARYSVRRLLPDSGTNGLAIFAHCLTKGYTMRIPALLITAFLMPVASSAQ